MCRDRPPSGRFPRRSALQAARHAIHPLSEPSIIIVWMGGWIIVKTESMRRANKFYWLYQICGWGAYSVIGLWTAVLEHGWRPSATYGYILFFLYNIALTHLLRGVIHRRAWTRLSLPGILVRLALTWPLEEIFDGHNSGWIDFGVPGTESVAGTTTPATVFAGAKQRSQA